MAQTAKQKAWLEAQPLCIADGCQRKIVNIKNSLCANHYAKTPQGRDLIIRRKYGLKLGEFDNMLKMQDNACGICGKKESIGRYGQVNRLCVDHDHKTGVVRGLLCHTCNRGLGLFMDDNRLLTRALMWLKMDELPDEKFVWVYEGEKNGTV